MLLALAVAFSNGCSLFSGMFQRIVTFPVDFHWNFPMDVQWHFPMKVHLCTYVFIVACIMLCYDIILSV